MAVDPDTEIITDTEVTAGNAGDAGVAEDLIDDLVDDTEETTGGTTLCGPDGDGETDRRTVYGDAAYGTGEPWIISPRPTSPPAVRPSRPPLPAACSPSTVSTSTSKPTPSPARAGVTVTIRRRPDGGGMATFAWHCSHCVATP